MKKCKQQKWYYWNCQQIKSTKKIKPVGTHITKNLNNHFLKEQYFKLKRRSPEYQTRPSLNVLDKHCKNLLQKNCNLTKQNSPEPFSTKPIDSLNQKITIEEIKESIKYMKTKKAPGLDNITNEMIKCSNRNMIEHLQTLFNNNMEYSYCPTSWNQG